MDSVKQEQKYSTLYPWIIYFKMLWAEQLRHKLISYNPLSHIWMFTVLFMALIPLVCRVRNQPMFRSPPIIKLIAITWFNLKFIHAQKMLLVRPFYLPHTTTAVESGALQHWCTFCRDVTNSVIHVEVQPLWFVE